ncbi:MAG: radical SAM protein [Caldiserica bacterium]|nr:radical SAM protein [Caldisericota bacterium]
MRIENVNFSGFWEKHTARNNFLKCSIELTYSCNLKCRHCYISSNDSPHLISLDILKNYIAELIEKGALFFTFTGGEPMLHPEWENIIRFTRSKGGILTLLSNGTLIQEKEAEILRETVNRVEVSFLGGREKTHDYFTGTPGSFKKVTRAVNILRGKGVPTTVKYILLKGNEQEFTEIKKFSLNLGCKFIYTYALFPKWNHDDNKSLRLTSTEVLQFMKSIDTAPLVCKDKGTTHPENTPFYCMAGRNSFTITPYGEVKPCPNLPYPSFPISEGGVYKAAKKLSSWIKKLHPSSNYLCPNCEFSPYCNKCPADGWLYNRNFESCVPWLKELAKCFYKEAHAGKRNTL